MIRTMKGLLTYLLFYLVFANLLYRFATQQRTIVVTKAGITKNKKPGTFL